MYKVFILSRNRPIYLWSCLDSLYRLTRSPAQFVFIDSASDDPLIRDVVRGFERRGMFHTVIWLTENDAAQIRRLAAGLLTPEDEFVAFVEADTVILPGPFDCWLEHMCGIMRADPQLALLGSRVDADDFVPLEQSRRIAPEMSEYDIRDITHHEDPERQRHLPESEEQLVFSPHNPAGRLLVMRPDAILRAGAASDSDLHDKLRALGYTTGISTRVRHRHLSLLNIFDYPKYDMKSRNAYMRGLTYRAQAEARGFARGAATHTTEPDVHLLTEDGRVEAEREENVYRFRLAAPPVELWLASRCGFALDSDDQRPLGIGIDRLLVDGQEVLFARSLEAGWYGPEAAWRWTSGRAELPPGRQIELRVIATVDYECAAAEA